MTTPTPMIQRMARAIRESFVQTAMDTDEPPGLFAVGDDDMLEAAQAALRELETPDEGMVLEGWKTAGTLHTDGVASTFTAMIRKAQGEQG